MILTITLNPLLERRLIYDSVELGLSNRCKCEFFYAGGKGINVSKQLNHLGIKNHAFTFLGGSNGKILRHLLTEEKIEFTVVSAKSETRIADVIFEEANNRVTTFFGMNSVISDDEAEDLKSKLEKMIQNCSTVIFSGSSPSKATDHIIEFGINLAHKHDKTCFIDTYGVHLNNSISAAPTAVHNNIEEVEKSIGISLKSENQKIEYLRSLYNRGIKLAFLTDGGNPFYVSKFDFIYKVTPPKVEVKDSTGSGDSFVSGILYGLENSIVFEDFIRIGTALGAANAAEYETSQIKLENISGLISSVIIEPIGKKMKLINDQPNY